MSDKSSKRNPYPKETTGSRIAAKVRSEANDLTERDREELFNSGMAMIYGKSGDSKKVSA